MASKNTVAHTTHAAHKRVYIVVMRREHSHVARLHAYLDACLYNGLLYPRGCATLLRCRLGCCCCCCTFSFALCFWLLALLAAPFARLGGCLVSSAICRGTTCRRCYITSAAPLLLSAGVGQALWREAQQQQRFLTATDVHIQYLRAPPAVQPSVSYSGCCCSSSTHTQLARNLPNRRLSHWLGVQLGQSYPWCQSCPHQEQPKCAPPLPCPRCPPGSMCETTPQSRPPHCPAAAVARDLRTAKHTHVNAE